MSILDKYAGLPSFIRRKSPPICPNLPNLPSKMKKSSPALYQLINSLSKSEKRYFHQFARRHVIGEQNQYLDLYQAIEQLPAWDLALLREKLADHPQAAYLPVAKHQLYQQVLDSLQQYHQGQHPPMTVQRWLHQAELLSARGLLQQAGKLLQKAQAAAEEREDQALLLTVLRAQQRHLSRKGLAQVPAETFEALVQAEAQCLDALQQEHALWAWSARLFRCHAVQGEVADLSAPAAADLAPQSFQAHLAYQQARGTWHYLRNEPELARQASQARLEMFYARPSRIRHYPSPYLSTLNNYLVDCLRLGRYADMQAPMQAARDLIEQPAYRKVPRLAMDVFRLTYLLELNLHLNQGDYAAANQLIPTVEAGLKRYQAQLPLLNLLTFHYLLAYLAFQQGAWRSALRRLQPLINHPKRAHLSALTQAALLLQLLLHHELGDQDLLDHLLRRYERQLPADQAFPGKILAHTLRRIAATPDPSAQQGHWQVLHQALAQGTEGSALQYLDLQAWVGKKLVPPEPNL
jgi:hypothetical protein